MLKLFNDCTVEISNKVNSTMNVPYEKQTLDNPNPMARFAHQSRFRFSKSIVLGWLSSHSVVFDYGCGHGRFLAELYKIIPKDKTSVQLFGYDPYLKLTFDGYTVTHSLETVRDQSIDILTCLEVLEHLSDEELKIFIDFARRKLVCGGKILVTVPIMVGPVLILKELSRCILFRRKSDTSLKEIFLAALIGVPPTRADDIKGSHKGFNWKNVYRYLKNDFDCIKIEFSPFTALGWYGNSQAIMQFQKVDAR